MKDILNNNIIGNVRKDNCFDFLRYLFAISLIIAHFCTLTGTDQFWFITGGMRVKAFFTITGFLVTYSFLRRNCDVKAYAVKRFARIVPAYVVCILFCLLLGCGVSKLNILDFVSSPQTAKYALSNFLMLNWLEPELPSTFQDNIRPQMNGSLWSMKQEVIFYILVPFIIWVLKKTERRYIAFFSVVLGVLSYNYISVQLQYFIFFFSGMFLLLYFDVFSKYIRYIIPFALILESFVYCFDIPLVSSFCYALEPLTFSSLIIGIAYHFRPMNFLRKYDNVTYGLYLYHFPIIQTLILFGVKDYDIRICFALTFLLTTIAAFLSWFLIEKPLINKYRQA